MWDENTIRRTHFDYPLLITVILLTGLGLTMVYSSSAVLAQEKFGDGLFFLKRVLVFATFGFLVLVMTMKVPYLFWRRFAYLFLVFNLFLLILVLFSGLGFSVGGARRWLRFGPFRFQPSELAKLCIIIFMAYSLEKKFERMEKFMVGIFPHILIPGVLILLVLLGKDLGASFIMGLLILTLLFLGGAKIKHLVLLCLTALPVLFHLVTQEGYRVKRLLSFLNPWGDRYGAGFQMIQSFLAFNEGGILGKGLGAGQQKLFYLPEAHTDFIFSVLGEELGFVGVWITIGLFLIFIYRCLRIAILAPDLFGRYLTLGIVILISTQSLLNMGVVMGLLPTKGLVLPFIGYGGSALVTSLMAVGILLNISTYQKADTPPMFNRGS